MGKVSFSAVR